jgi:hypothetical protein
MPKKFIKRFMPDHHALRNHRHLRIFGERLHDPNLWHLNRRSASGAFAVGLFMAFIPVPFQMVLAALGAFWFRVNLPIAVALVWLTNPLTMPPIFYVTYKVGSWLLGRQGPSREFEASYDWLAQELGAVWQPFLLGSLIFAVLAAAVGYFTIRSLWRLRVIRHWQRKKDARAEREAAEQNP